ncbi:MAG: cation:proton antiporter [Tannerellaceae bacterium]|jgi:Kef-type K+ transport system membrane component KefB|nr:cation:proton antiporter [Tannerellaceae bacterium]
MNDNIKSAIKYLLMIAIFGAIIYFIIYCGDAKYSQAAGALRNSLNVNPVEGFAAFTDLFIHEIKSPVGIFLLQMIIILIVSRFFAYLFMKLKQPTVLGEILAGIALGPSILGIIWPEASAFIFTESSLSTISIVSSIGLILFMFTIGMELDVKKVRKKLKETILISHAGIIMPLAIGVVIAYFAYEKYAEHETPFFAFALFVGISMSITAFPVLARIIQERKMTKTHLGALALGCAANGDITAWCLLAMIVAIVQAGTILSAIFSLAAAVVYLFIMFSSWLRKRLHKVCTYYNEEGIMGRRTIALLFLVLTISAYLSQIIGLHALFGAFIAGLVMPEDINFRRALTNKVEDISLTFFLPLFFVSTGLRTEIALLNTADMWIMCGIIILGAIIGKAGGVYFAARFAAGETHTNSLTLGALMNTRGLMELIVLTIGYEMHVLSPAIFVMLVIMTLVTTFMTGPLLWLLNHFYEKPSQRSDDRIFRLLLPFGRSSSGVELLNIAHKMFSHDEAKKLNVTALHLASDTMTNPLFDENYDAPGSAPILSRASLLGISIEVLNYTTCDVAHDIVKTANEAPYDFFLVGAGPSQSEPVAATKKQRRSKVRQRLAKALHGLSNISEWILPCEEDKIKIFVENVQCPVGIFINRNFTDATDILVLVTSAADCFLFNYIRQLKGLTRKGAVRIVLLASPAGDRALYEELKVHAQAIQATNVERCDELDAEFLHTHNFMIVSYKSYSELSERNAEVLRHAPSTLIISERPEKTEE